jgi:hypothetical protein
MEIANLVSLCHGRASCRKSMQVVSTQQAKTNEIVIATKIVKGEKQLTVVPAYEKCCVDVEIANISLIPQVMNSDSCQKSRQAVSQSKMNEIRIAAKIFCTHSIRGEHCSAIVYTWIRQPIFAILNGRIGTSSSPIHRQNALPLSNRRNARPLLHHHQPSRQRQTASSSAKPVDCNNFNSVFGHP